MPVQSDDVSRSTRGCPICFSPNYRGRKPRRLYGIDVCRSCAHEFASRRQAAYLVDVLLWVLLGGGLQAVALGISLEHGIWAMLFGTLRVLAWPPRVTVILLPLLLFFLLFCMKDGFAGYSPGKRIFGVRVVSAETNKPIWFRASVIRNVLLFVLQAAPPLGSLATFELWGLLKVASVIVLALIGGVLSNGPRWGDGLAGTKVIWTKYAFRVPFGLRGRFCSKCGYDLTGNESGICPECGHPCDVAQPAAAV